MSPGCENLYDIIAGEEIKELKLKKDDIIRLPAKTGRKKPYFT